MCLTPIRSGGNVFSCRSCDQCVEKRLNVWVTRALAEASVAGHTYAITATYRNLPSGEKPLGATVFNYKDIKLFLAHLRSRYARHYGTTGEIRYLACGEQGSKGTQRVHWHIILFADKDIRPAINWVDFETKKPVAPLLVVPDRNYLADVWPHGHIMLQKPDKRGIKYALKYALKSEMGIEKSSGTKRYARSEEWASHFFRMSKKPPIGLRYLEKLVKAAAEGGYVYPDFRVSVPAGDGFWHLEGYFAQYWAGGMAEINARHRAEYGTDCAAWSSLLTAADQREMVGASVILSELLHYGAWQAKGPAAEARSAAGGSFPDTAESGGEVGPVLRVETDQQRRERVAIARQREFDATVRRCRGIVPCRHCQNGATDHDKAEWRRAFDLARELAFAVDPPQAGSLDSDDKGWRDQEFARRYKRAATGPGPFCGLRDTPGVLAAFAWWREHLDRIAQGRSAQPKGHGYKSGAVGSSGGRSPTVPGHR